MEENAETVIYENYKFVTKEDLERLNLTNLIGTNLLKAYMHGYFVDYGLYKKVLSNLVTTLYYVHVPQKNFQQNFLLFTIF
jgi:ribosome biogenesis protein ENP2